MVRSIDLLCLLNRPVVEPENNIAIIAVICEVGSSNRNWFVGIVRKHCQRASGIKTNTAYSCGIDIVLA